MAGGEEFEEAEVAEDLELLAGFGMLGEKSRLAPLQIEGVRHPASRGNSLKCGT